MFPDEDPARRLMFGRKTAAGLDFRSLIEDEVR